MQDGERCRGLPSRPMTVSVAGFPATALRAASTVLGCAPISAAMARPDFVLVHENVT